MNLPRLVVIAVVAAAASSRADGPQAVSPFAPTWSLGAGLTLGSSYPLGALGGLGSTGGLGSLGGLTFASPGVSPNVSVERMFSSRFALGLGLEAGVATGTTVGSTLASPVSVGVNLGVSPRFTLTPVSAPVDLAVFATAFIGYATATTPVSETQTYSAQTLTVGAAGGVALEKRFLERFAVRVQAQLVRLGLVRAWTSLPVASAPLVTEVRAVGSSFNATLVPAPSIELRLYL